MEFLFEIILEILISGLIVITEEPKVPKWIRYTAGIIVFLLFTAIISLLIIIGIKVFEQSIILSSILLLFGLLFVALGTIKARNTYLKISKNKNKEKISYTIIDRIITVCVVVTSIGIADRIMNYIKNDSFLVRLLLVIILMLVIRFIMYKVIDFLHTRQIIKNNENELD